MEPSIRLQVSFPPDLHARLEAEAAKQDRPRSYVVRKAVEAMLTGK